MSRREPLWVKNTVFGIYAPAGTPKDVVAKLNAEISRAMQSPELKARMGALAREIGLKAD